MGRGALLLLTVLVAVVGGVGYAQMRARQKELEAKQDNKKTGDSPQNPPAQPAPATRNDTPNKQNTNATRDPVDKAKDDIGKTITSTINDVTGVVGNVVGTIKKVGGLFGGYMSGTNVPTKQQQDQAYQDITGGSAWFN